jgi:hypothetical protein
MIGYQELFSILIEEEPDRLGICFTFITDGPDLQIQFVL